MTERRKELDIEPALVPQLWENAVATCWPRIRRGVRNRPKRCAATAACLKADKNTKEASQELKQESRCFSVASQPSSFSRLPAVLRSIETAGQTVSQAAGIPENQLQSCPSKTESEKKPPTRTFSIDETLQTDPDALANDQQDLQT